MTSRLQFELFMREKRAQVSDKQLPQVTQANRQPAEMAA